jgi:FixJ family two-component response regulator
MTMQMAFRTAPATEMFVVDDDPCVRDALAVVFAHAGYQVRGFAEGSSFLAAARLRTPSCVLLDINLPGRSGIDLLRDLDAQHYGAPIFIISARGDVPLAVDAIKHGAFDFIEKPFDIESVVARVREGIAGWKPPAANGSAGAGAQSLRNMEQLTPREREVLSQVAGGASNKEAGRRLGISPRTVEVHRARIMDKLGAKNAADLVRIVLGHSRAG